MMIHRILLFVLMLATPLHAAETYDLIFKQGTLADLPDSAILEYDRLVVIAANPDYAQRNTGMVQLNFEPQDIVRLRFVQGAQHRSLGDFPASVGNPVIMYFVETVLRDVAQEAGGSPFYIRNRIKEALVATVPIEDATIRFDGTDATTRQIVLRPFEADRNRDRMGVYADLALTFTMSEDVPGWYVSLVATAPGRDGVPGYSNALTLMPTEAAQ